MARTIRPQPRRTTVAIVGDGHTERIYFSDVKDTDRPKNLHIFPDYPKKTGNYKGVLDRAVQLADEYDFVYALIDMDKIYQDNLEATYKKAKALAEKSGVIVLENNPCFEMWLLLHFMYTGKSFSNCEKVCQQLKSAGCINGYDKSEKFLKCSRLYSRYKNELVKKAIPGAKKLGKERIGQNRLFPRAETFKFFEWYLKNGL